MAPLLAVRITDLQESDGAAIAQAAALLIEAFPQSWPDEESALAEVHDSFEPERLSLVALGEDGSVLGWIGGISEYNGNVWELHPLVVRTDQRGQGVGQALVEALEARVRALGGLTITLGTDDEHDQTSLSGVNLYPDVWAHLATLRNLRRHPYEFYQRLGYIIVGVIPDANGPGKPDILVNDPRLEAGGLHQQAPTLTRLSPAVWGYVSGEIGTLGCPRQSQALRFAVKQAQRGKSPCGGRQTPT